VNYCYRLYGVSLLATEAVPGLQPDSSGSEKADICLELGSPPEWVRQARLLPAQRVHQVAAEPATEDPAFVVTSYGVDHSFGLSYSDGTEFMVRSDGGRIWGAWNAPWTKEDWATYFLGPVMGFVLRRRHVIPLHASAVSVAGRAIILCGDAHAGKSTTAGALALRNVPVLCEDIAALRLAEGGYWVEPGYPRVCLWPDAARMLMGREDALPLLTPNWDKRYLPLDGPLARFQPERCPVGGIYLLAPRAREEPASRIEPVNRKEALLELVQNSYMNWLLDREQRAREFEVLGHLVEQVPVRRLVLHRDPKGIEDLCGVILEDALCLPRRALAAPQPNTR